MKNQKGVSPLLIILLAVVAIGSVAIILSSQGKLGNQGVTQNTPAITNAADLNAASTDLDNTDMGQFDSDMNQLKVDASAF